MKKTLESELLDCLENHATPEWNESLKKRLESVRSYLDSDEWTKGISVYLRAALGTCLAKLMTAAATPEQYHYARGFIAALRLVIALPATVEAEIERESKAESKKAPQPYTG